VLAMRRRGKREEYDDRILGSGSFVNSIFQEAEDRQRRQMKHKRSGKTIRKIADEVCKERGINQLELQAGGKRSAVSDARAIIAHRCREELGESAAEIARHLGVNTSCIVRAIERARTGQKRN
jgi:chromosomal replication initiation ATPase DnaA